MQNKLNTHLNEHFNQSNLRFIYLADFQYRGGVEIIAQARCYTTNYNKAEQLYRQGRYAEAKRHYAAASACPDKPKQNNIAARISACDNAINEIRQRERAEQQRQEAERERIRKEQERQEQERREREEAERNGYIRITNIKFGNTDYDGNIISDYGSTLYALSIHFLRPRIFYEELCKSSRSETFDVKIYKPDGSLVTGTSSPSGYTYSSTETIYPGNNQVTFPGWGNDNGGYYTPGTYRFEVWHDGNFVYSTDVSLLGNPGERYAKIESIWVDHNHQMQDGVKGMLIHVKFFVYNMLNRTGRCNAYFYYDNADNTPLQDLNNSYCTTSGHVAMGRDFTPPYKDTTYNDFTLFIPNYELHVTGNQSLKFCIRIYDKASDEWLCRSDWQHFTYGY